MSLLGFALLLMGAKQGWQRVAQGFTLPVVFTSFLALLGYLYEAESLYRVSSFIPMALHTAVLFLFLSLGVLASRSHCGFMTIFASSGPAGVMVRRLLPSAVLIVSVLGWIRMTGERNGLYTSEIGVTLYTAAAIALLAVVIWWTGRMLRRVDVQRQHLVEERERFFALSLDLLCIAGFDGFFRNLNPAWEKALGFSRQELLGEPYVNFVHPDDREATMAEARKIAAGARVLAFENRYRCKDGSYRWLVWSATPHGETQLIYAAARDITERKRTDETIQELNRAVEQRALELELANKELEAFSYSVSHDLRAPLRHVSGFVELLQKGAGSTLDSKNQRYLRLISESAEQMGRLIDDLLSFSRMGRAEMQKTTLDLRQLVDGIIKNLNQEIQGREVVWNIASLPQVQADPSLMRQVMVNLISNALKYSHTRRRTEIEIGSKHDTNGEHILFIRDNGVGFDMAYADKLFGVFQRLHDTDEFEGTGIGLANVRRMISRHGGRTWAEGVVGGGATFYFSLPKSQATKL